MARWSAVDGGDSEDVVFMKMEIIGGSSNGRDREGRRSRWGRRGTFTDDLVCGSSHRRERGVLESCVSGCRRKQVQENHLVDDGWIR